MFEFGAEFSRKVFIGDPSELWQAPEESSFHDFMPGEWKISWRSDEPQVIFGKSPDLGPRSLISVIDIDGDGQMAGVISGDILTPGDEFQKEIIDSINWEQDVKTPVGFRGKGLVAQTSYLGRPCKVILEKEPESGLIQAFALLLLGQE